MPDDPPGEQLAGAADPLFDFAVALPNQLAESVGWQRGDGTWVRGMALRENMPRMLRRAALAAIALGLVPGTLIVASSGDAGPLRPGRPRSTA